MTTLAELKHKYSGQTIPDWELAKLATVAEAVATVAEPVKRKPGRHKKVDDVVEPDPVSDGDSNAD